MRDSELWRYVTRNVTPYRSPRPLVSQTLSSPEPKALRNLPTSDSPSREPPARRAPLPLKLGVLTAMDKRTGQRFKRGDMPMEARLDLHGMTLDQAHGALSAFVRGAHSRGARCVMVVTGKGKLSDGGGKIRREVPHWLNRPDLRPLVLAVTEARPFHGGAGALYVLLKRTRE